MRILFITLANCLSGGARKQRHGGYQKHASGDTGYNSQQRLLPIQMLAIAGELMDAGHTIHWLDESLDTSNKSAFLEKANAFNPDVLFFVCSNQHTRSLMASIAVKTNSLVGNEYISDDVLRPARQWCDTLADRKISVELLCAKLGT